MGLRSPSKKNILGTYLVYSYTDQQAGKIIPIWLMGVPREKVYIRLENIQGIVYIFDNDRRMYAITRGYTKF
jgi:hypothetical protein